MEFYDEYCIIDFLEAEYINDWLSTIPDNLWRKYRLKILNNIYKLTDKSIITFVIKKIKLNLPKYIVSNFHNINLELLKYCVEYDFIKLQQEIKLNIYTYKQIITYCICYHNYQFNKYFYETIYFELEPSHKGNPEQINFVHENNMFYNYFINLGVIRDYNSIVYYNEKFPNIFKKCKSTQYKQNIFFDIYTNSNMNNFDDFINLKNILNFDDLIVKKTMLFGNLSKYNYDNDYIPPPTNNDNFIPKICRDRDTDYIIQFLNWTYSDTKFKITYHHVLVIMIYTSLSNNKEKVLSIYNYLVQKQKWNFTDELYTQIIQEIVNYSSNTGKTCKDIIYEFINMGGKITGHPTYTNYMNQIKIKKIKN